MTIEEQRYLEECKKVLKHEQMDIVTMAMDYGLPIAEIRKVVQSNQSAECMREIVFGMMEGISTEALEFLCENDFNQYQMKEIREGIVHGLAFEQVKTYAIRGIKAVGFRGEPGAEAKAGKGSKRGEKRKKGGYAYGKEKSNPYDRRGCLPACSGNRSSRMV